MPNTSGKVFRILIWTSFVLNLIFFMLLWSYRTYFGNKLTHIVGFGVVRTAIMVLPIVNIIMSGIHLKKFEESRKSIFCLLILSVLLLIMIFPALLVANGGFEGRDPTVDLAVAHRDVNLCNYAYFADIQECYVKVASAIGKPELCDKLPIDTPYSVEIRDQLHASDISGCYDNTKFLIAINKKDPSLCADIKDQALRGSCYERTNATAQEPKTNAPPLPPS